MSWFFLRRWIRDWFQLRSRLAAEPESLICMRRQLKRRKEEEEEDDEEEEVGVLTTGHSRLVIQPVSYRHTGKAFFEHNTESDEGF